MTSRIRVSITMLVLVLLLGSLSAIACGSSSKSNTPTPAKTVAPATTATKAPAATSTKAATTSTAAPSASNTPSAGAQTVAATIKDFEFGPATITIKVGDTVTWTNNGPSAHTVTADDGSFDSGNMSQGGTYSHTFQTAGTFPYHCTIHPFMKAQVVVQ